MENSVSSIIVTFNRKAELVRCIDAVLHQSYKVKNLVIVNNASTDGTENVIREKFDYVSDIPCEIENVDKVCLLKSKNANDATTIYLINMIKNSGGSGGFYTGLRFSDENLKTSQYWMMDDDGYPSENCLEMLMSKANQFDYIMPTSIDIAEHTKLSWATRMRNGKKTLSYEELKNSWGQIMDYVTPFNGILLSQKCVTDVGYINKDFFIWGDEYEHYWRCKQKNIQPVTLMSAQFYHPSMKLPFVKICFGLFPIAYVDNPLRMVCLARNYTYIYLHYNQKYKIVIKWLMYWWLFIITRHGDFAGWKLYKASVKDGFKGDFTRHLQYLK